MTSHHGSKGIKERTYAWRMSEALQFPIRDPLKLLAAAVIARWVEDQHKGSVDEIGEEWAEMAEIPRHWLVMSDA